jgi:hypothetical protein
MRRRRQFFALLMATAIVLAMMLGVLTIALKHVPSFYHRGEVPLAADRQQLAQEFMKRSEDFFNLINNSQPWALNISQDQLNGYLQDEQSRSAGLFTFPESVHDPRVEFGPDRLRIGFRYGTGWSSVVVSVDVKAWLVAKEPNVLAVELCGVSVGGVPIGSHAIMDYVTDIAKYQEAEVRWYRHGSHPVALVRLQANQSRPTLVIRKFELQVGKLILSGKPTSDTPAPETAAVGQ